MLWLMWMMGCSCGEGPEPSDSATSTSSPVSVAGDCDPEDPFCEVDCADGVDNDYNGLVDCEDPECFDVAGCFEASCDDGADDDGDGLVDCEDEDCWRDESVCPTSWVFLEAEGVTRSRWLQGAPGSCASVTTSDSVQVLQPRGRVLVGTEPSAVPICTWSASSSILRVDGLGAVQAEGPRGLTWDEGCQRFGSLRPPLTSLAFDGTSITVLAGQRAVWTAPWVSATSERFYQGSPTSPGGYCTTLLESTFGPVTGSAP